MPFWVTKAPVLGRAFLATVAAALATRPAGALLVTPKVRLSAQNGFNPNQDSTITALAANEIDFSGYTAGGYAWTPSGPLNLGPNSLGVTGSVVPTAGTATPFVTGVCYGYWVDDGVNVILSESFPPGTTFNFNLPDDFVELNVVLPFNFRAQTS